MGGLCSPGLVKSGGGDKGGPGLGAVESGPNKVPEGRSGRTRRERGNLVPKSCVSSLGITIVLSVSR